MSSTIYFFFILKIFNNKDCPFLKIKIGLFFLFENKLLICQQKLEGHSDWKPYYYQQEEYFPISNYGDKIIQFWNKDEQWK
ncbi:unnamed protein product [Paramecium sonneborni]|uniref:Uncharacterized protein n=1 Tax=Paramecium sonneborni TaxID=65129 RepID=A0A8S1RLD7_9CILI|nr:unnamed protein product [Paramecium sonneborni]